MSWRQRILTASKDALRKAVRSFGYEITAHSHMRNHELRRDKLLHDSGVTLVIDGGANRGQYAARIRQGGYRGRIVSVEPLAAAFRELARSADRDPEWTCVHAALGERRGEATINVAAVDQVSSLLPVAGPADAYGWRSITTETICLTTVADVLDEHSQSGDRIHLKLDLQGYELHALIGAENKLRRCASLEVELTTVPLYEGASAAPAVFSYLAARDFEIFSLHPSSVDFRSGRVVELESLFVSAQAKRP